MYIVKVSVPAGAQPWVRGPSCLVHCVWVLRAGQGCHGYNTEFFPAARQRGINDMAKSSSGGQDASKDSEGDMIFAAENHCALPQEGDGEARLGVAGSALPARKRSRSFEDDRNQATGTSQWDGVSRKTARHRLSPSGARPREARQETEDSLSWRSAESGGPSEEVEDVGPDPIPDSYYGLLGTLPGQEAQSHISSLPNEVLRHIFAFLPVEDLYWNVSLVCHLWRDIISDPLVRRPLVAPRCFLGKHTGWLRSQQTLTFLQKW